jgi:hypothetical protein
MDQLQRGNCGHLESYIAQTFSQVLKIEYVGTGVGEGWGIITLYKVRPLPKF